MSARGGGGVAIALRSVSSASLVSMVGLVSLVSSVSSVSSANSCLVRAYWVDEKGECVSWGVWTTVLC